MTRSKPLSVAPLLLAALSCLSACGSGTEGRLVQVTFAFEPEAEADSARELGSFETDTGWDVTLERAELAVAAIYLFAPEQDPGVMARLSQALVPVARAHGGHDPLSGKRVRAELLESQHLDLLDPGLRTLAEVEAEAGAIAALAIDIAQSSDDITPELEGRQAFIAGEATRQGETVRFAGGLEVPNAGLTRRVEKTIDPVSLEQRDTLVIRIRPSVWLKHAELGRLEPAQAEDEPRAITQGSQVGRAWLVAVRSPAALAFEHTKETRDDRQAD